MNTPNASTALSKALKKDYNRGKVGVPWLELAGILEPLRGNLIVVLGAPGQGKSALALNWALKSNSPSLLLSLDTDLTSQAIRTASVLSGVPMDEVKQNPDAWAEYVEKMAWRCRAYDLNVKPKELLGLIRAETEFWGQPPGLTVVDNVSNLVQEGGYEEYRSIFVDLHRVARMGDTCIVALHHVKRSGAPGSPLGLFAGQYSGEQEAEIVLGLWSKGNTNFLNVSVDKNRSGKASPDGQLYVTLKFDHDTMRIEDLSPEETALAVFGGQL